jgi:hypothetical protein
MSPPMLLPWRHASWHGWCDGAKGMSRTSRGSVGKKFGGHPWVPLLSFGSHIFQTTNCLRGFRHVCARPVRTESITWSAAFAQNSQFFLQMWVHLCLWTTLLRQVHWIHDACHKAADAEELFQDLSRLQVVTGRVCGCLDVWPTYFLGLPTTRVKQTHCG